MNVIIVYEANTGNERAVADKMAEVVRVAGHECSVESIVDADPKRASRAHAAIIGCWTAGNPIFRQHPSDGVLDFIDGMSLNGRPVAVFATYRVAIGSTLRQLAMAVESAGGKVTGMYKVKGSHLPDGFEAWAESLDSGVAI
jgi:flavodoxin